MHFYVKWVIISIDRAEVLLVYKIFLRRSSFMKEIIVYDEAVKVSRKNQAELKRLEKESGVPEDLLAVIWGYISQAVMDCREHYQKTPPRPSVKKVFTYNAFLLREYEPLLETIAELLPELGCRAANPEHLRQELIQEF